MDIRKHVSLTVTPQDNAVIREGCIDGQLNIHQSGRSLCVDFSSLSDKEYEEAAITLQRIAEGMFRKLGKVPNGTTDHNF